jgi:integrase
VDHCKKHYYHEAVYDEHGSKVAGVRSVKPAHAALDNLVAYFGDRRIRTIQTEDLLGYKKHRLGQGVKIATAHRELAKARRIFNIAITKEWLSRNAFAGDKTLIQTATEKKRGYVLTPAQETALYKVIRETPEWAHTLPIFMMALENGARRGTLIDLLRWQDVDFDRELITLTTYKDKNVRRWPVAMGDELKRELLKIKPPIIDPEARVFAQASINFRKIKDAAFKKIGLKARLHDLRHSAATRLANSGARLEQVKYVLGHASVETTQRYFHETDELHIEIRSIFNRRRDDTRRSVRDTISRLTAEKAPKHRGTRAA